MFSYFNSLFITFIFSSRVAILSKTMEIDEIIVPDVVLSGIPDGVVLDCLYTVEHEQFTLQWIFNNSSPIYQWRPHSEPMVAGMLEGKLDFTYRSSTFTTDERRGLHIVAVDPDLSGEYTCRIFNDLQEVQQTRTMLVYSPERDLMLNFNEEDKGTTIKCIVKGVYPQPEVALEHDRIPLRKQHQRVWRSEGSLYDAETTAFLSNTERCQPREIICRLQLPQAGYAAIKKEILYLKGDKICENTGSLTMSNINLFLALLVAPYLWFC